MGQANRARGHHGMSSPDAAAQQSEAGTPYGFGIGRWLRNAYLKRRRMLMLVTLVLMFVMVMLAPRIFITVPSGHAGVLWLRFFGGGSDQQQPLREGLHVIFPWDSIYIYDMRMKTAESTYEVISKEGLQFSVRLSYRWRLNPNRLAALHRNIGYDYLSVLVAPQIGSVARSRIALYTAQDVLSDQRAKVQQEIFQYTVSHEAPNSIGTANDKGTALTDDLVFLLDILLKDIVLPPRLKSAIEGKLEQSQIADEYRFRIEREKLESERKKIEAQGIQEFQQTVQAGISEAYLKWRGIEATLQLATSDNAKVVIIGGGGSDGLPLILNTSDAPAAAADAAKAPVDPDGAVAAKIRRLSSSIDAAPPAAQSISGLEVENGKKVLQAKNEQDQAAALNPIVPGNMSALSYLLQQIGSALEHSARAGDQQP
jgi:regulator of protease activity HflC (stomatin/prohibitin superfamily)